MARWRSSAGTPFISLVAVPSLRKKTRKSCCAASWPDPRRESPVQVTNACDAARAGCGAPLPHPDPWTCALRAGRTLCRRLREELPEADAGVGVSGGVAVAGNVGAAHRFEYTVIGDPVNEAARLTEIAKTVDARVLASEALLSRAVEEERSRWKLSAEVELRGRDAPTRVWVPT